MVKYAMVARLSSVEGYSYSAGKQPTVQKPRRVGRQVDESQMNDVYLA